MKYAAAPQQEPGPEGETIPCGIEAAETPTHGDPQSGYAFEGRASAMTRSLESPTCANAPERCAGGSPAGLYLPTIEGQEAPLDPCPQASKFAPIMHG